MNSVGFGGNMKWRQLCVTVIVLSMSIVAVMQEAEDLLPVNQLKGKQDTFVVTVFPEGGRFTFPTYENPADAFFVVVEEGFFTQATDIILTFDDVLLDSSKYFDESFQVTAVTPTLQVSFPFSHIPDSDTEGIMIFSLPLLEGHEFVTNSTANHFNEAIGQLHPPLEGAQNPNFDVFFMLDDKLGFMNTVTLQDVYGNFNDDVQVKLSLQTIEVLRSE